MGDAVIGYTTGVYDMFHIGHLNLLRNASEYCDELIVGVSTDELSMAKKNKRPLISYPERVEIISNVRYVDRVVAQTSMDKMEAWRRLQFHIMFVGDDWRGTPAWDRIEREFGLLGVQIVYLPYTAHTSSTAIRKVVFGG